MNNPHVPQIYRLFERDEKLAAVHAQNIICRDVKPSNIMLTEKNFVKLTDFGIARIFKPDTAADTEVLSTRGYAPPEQYGLFDLGQTDPRSDIYALGVTLKELLGKDYGGRLKKFLDKCTAQKPARRYQSADELRDVVTRSKIFGRAKKFFPPKRSTLPKLKLNRPGKYLPVLSK